MTTPPRLTVERAAAGHRRRQDRHRRRRLHRHAGTAAGQADARPVLPRPRARARHRGVQLPARRRRRHEHRRRLRHQLVGARLRRHDVRPRPGHAAPHARPALLGHGPVRPVLARRQRPGARSRRARCCRPRSTRRPSSGSSRLTGTELEFIVFEDTYDAGLGPRATTASRGANRYNVDYSILGGTAGRAAAARDPQRDVCRAASPSRAPRGSATPASTRSPSSTTRSCAPATTTSSTRRRPRRSRPCTASR